MTDRRPLDDADHLQILAAAARNAPTRPVTITREQHVRRVAEQGSMKRIEVVFITVLGVGLLCLVLRKSESAEAPARTGAEATRPLERPPFPETPPPPESGSARRELDAPQPATEAIAAASKLLVESSPPGEPRVESQASGELEVMLVNLHAEPSELDMAVDQCIERLAATPGGLPHADGKEPDLEQLRKSARVELVGLGQYRDLPRPMLRLREPVTPESPPALDEIMKEIAEALDSNFENGQRPTADDVLATLEDERHRAVVSGEMKREVPPAVNGPTRVADLAPGKYLLSVEIGKSSRYPIVLGYEVVDVLPGTTTSITLTLADPPSTEVGDPVPLEGTLYVPPAWGDVSPSISFERLGRPDLEPEHSPTLTYSRTERVEGPSRLYRWNAGLVLPGSYLATVDLFGTWRVIEVRPEGCRDAEIKVGEPGDVQVHLLDVETGLEVEACRCSWSCADRPGGGPHFEARFNRATRTHDFRAPLGFVDLVVWGEPKFAFVTQRLQVAPGRNEFTIQLEHACGVRLSLRESGTVVAWPEHHDAPVWLPARNSPLNERSQPSIEAIGGEGHEARSGREGSAWYLSVSAPGRYRVTIPPIDGYEAIAPFEVEIPRATFVERQISLQRRH